MMKRVRIGYDIKNVSDTSNILEFEQDSDNPRRRIPSQFSSNISHVDIVASCLRRILPRVEVLDDMQPLRNKYIKFWVGCLIEVDFVAFRFEFLRQFQLEFTRFIGTKFDVESAFNVVFMLQDSEILQYLWNAAVTVVEQTNLAQFTLNNESSAESHIPIPVQIFQRLIGECVLFMLAEGGHTFVVSDLRRLLSN
ncbi:hypothetical protein HK096_006184 [Nowakowskiella sp. JEL0078]|nr:hypothetical protein HK096_006184 [Nowakowskiella sp. JEL0078]